MQSIAQVDTIPSYNTLDNTNFLSSQEYPEQIARILPDRPCILNSFRLHLTGDVGKCKIHIYGHEGGHVIPTLKDDLIEPIVFVKTNVGDTTFTFLLEDTLRFDNDQFYIALDEFDGDFGMKQDLTYFTEFCQSATGGNYNPTYVLSDALSKYIGKDYHLSIDVLLSYDTPTDPRFKDVTTEIGLPENRYNYSVAWADVNNDYWTDLLMGQHLYINKGGTFQQVKLHPEPASENYIKRSIFVDMNNDTHWDIILFGGSNSWLYLNDGAGNFEKHRLSIPAVTFLQGFSVSDINLDGYPDLVLAQLWNEYPVPQPNYLFLNNGSLDFENVTPRLYPDSNELYNFPDGVPCNENVRLTKIPNKNRNRRSRGSQFIDYDQDGDDDLYIANYYLETDEFYENDGKGFFTSIPAPKPIDQSDTMSNHGTSVSWYDFDNDGDFDVLIPQLAHPRNILKYDHRGTTLYENKEGEFQDITQSSGIEFEETHAGSSFGDLNNDGLVDLITTVYYGCRYVDLYMQQADYSFKMMTHQSGFNKMSTGSDVNFVDFNNDGKLDIAFAKEGNFHLYENTMPSDNNWVKVNLVCKSRNHFGIGAVVKVYAGEQVYTQAVGAGKGQGMQSPSTLHFGLAKSTMIDRIELLYGNEVIAIMENLTANKSYLLVEGQLP